MSALAHARRLASCGYATLPIVFGGKTPDVYLAPHGVHSASIDANMHGRWFSDERGVNRHNIAIAVPEHVLVVDVDPNCKRGNGIDSLTKLVKRFGPLPRGPRQVSGSGGIHLLFRRPDRPDLRGRLDVKLHPGVDMLGQGKYLLCGYCWTRSPWEVELPELPLWFQDLATDDYVPAERPGLNRTDVGDVMKRAAAYLEKCEPAVSGQGGHNTAFRVAASVIRGFDLDEEQAMMVLETWNGRCDPPWTKRDLRHKVRQAMKRGKDAVGGLLGR